MARIWAIIRSLARAVVREQKSLEGIRANNLFWILFLLGGAGMFVFLLVGAVALFPLCSDPYRRLPAERAGTWPVTARELRIVRITSVFLSPVAWLAIAVIVWTGRPQFFLFAVFVAAFAVPFPKGWAFRAVPGWFGELVRKNLRELLNLLDPYVALLLSGATLAYRIARPNLEPEALLVMSLVVVMTLSTCAQSLFALDAGASWERYRLMPIRGWRILAAKHMALTMIALPLTLPLHLMAPPAALLVAMAIGNHFAVHKRVLQTRWSLASGSLVPGLMQSVALVAAGRYAAHESAWIILPAVLLYASSTLFYGWRLEQET